MKLQINEARIAEFEANLAKLNKKIEKLFGIQNDLVVVYGDTDLRKVRVFEGADPNTGQAIYRTVEILLRNLDVTGSMVDKEIALEGWKFLATARYDRANSEAVWKGKPPAAMRERLTPVKAHVCDHCNKRVVRNVMFVVENVETGEQKAVGSTCSADFLGWNGTPDQILWMTDGLLTQLRGDFEIGEDDEVPRGMRYTVGYDLEHVLLATRRMANAYGNGWVLSQKMVTDDEGDTSLTTAEHVRVLFNPPLRSELRISLKDVFDQATEEDYKAIQDAIVDCTKKAASGDEFCQNLMVYIKDGYVDSRDLSMAVWIYGSWHNAIRREQAKKAPRLNEHFGDLNKMMDIEGLTIVYMNGGYGDYGWQNTLIMTDEAGRSFKVYSSHHYTDDIQVGVKINVRAKIMEHSVYDGKKTTRLGYFRIVSLNGEPV